MLNVPERQSLKAPDLFSTNSSSLNAALETDLTIRSLPDNSARTARIEENPYAYIDGFSFGLFPPNSHNFTLPTIAGDSVEITWLIEGMRQGTTFSIFSDSEPYWQDFTKKLSANQGSYRYIDFTDGERIQVKVNPVYVGGVTVTIAKRGNIVARPLNLDNINNGFVTWGYNVESNRTDQSFTLPPGLNAVAKLAYIDETGRVIQLLDQKQIEFRNNINSSFTTLVPSSTPDGAAFIRLFIEKTGAFAETTQEDNTVTVKNPLLKPNLIITEPKFLPGGGIEYGFKVDRNYVEAALGKQIKLSLIWVDEAGNWIKEEDSKFYNPKLAKDYFDSIKINRNILEGKPFEAKGLIAFIDSEQVVAENNEIDNATTLLTPFVWDMPQIMTNDSLPVAARLMRQWLSGKPKRATNSRDFSLEIDSQSVKIDWLTSGNADATGRGKAAYDTILKTALDSEGISNLGKKVTAWFRRNSTKNSLSLSRILKSEVNNTRALYAWNTRKQDVVAPAKWEDAGYLWAGVQTLAGQYPDDSFASLGRYTFYATPNFVARRNGDKIEITVKELQIFTLDSFDFIEDANSSLGTWSKTTGVVLPTDIFTTDGVKLTNKTFQDYRNTIGLGKDFLVQSDIRKINVNATFTFPVAARSKRTLEQEGLEGEELIYDYGVDPGESIRSDEEETFGNLA
ncbi:MAG: hypothetical protein KME18_25695 [Phormidium tanganyikae FI6-MK23]|jgi:hypothetical protein|nr:hypothetical protein [Phormidium tanganyikae FI6-MK23]